MTDERNVMDIHAASEEQAQPADGRRTWLGLLIVLLSAAATITAAVLAWRWLKH